MKYFFTSIKYLFLLSSVLAVNLVTGQGSFVLTVNFPEDALGDYDVVQANFGPAFCETADMTNDLIFIEDGMGGSEACDTVVNDIMGKIAILDRGSCDFSRKVLHAQEAGAMGVIVCNNVTEDNFSMAAGEFADSVTVPSWMLSLEDCAIIRVFVGDSVSVTLTKPFPEDNAADDVVIWEENFDGGFNGWVNNSLECAGVSDPVNATWEWRAGGDIGQGSFILDGTIMFSNTPCNGVVIFDSDFLDSEGDAADDNGGAIEGELSDGPCIVPQSAELISPVIDLSGVDPNSALGIKFVQNVRNFDARFFVGWSTDGGATWTESEVNLDIQVNLGVENIVRIILDGVSPGDQLMVKFRFDGDYYYWAIDDVRIIEFTGTNAMISEVFYTPLSYAFPKVFADADTFVFISNVVNRGATELVNVQLEVDIVNTDTEVSIFKDSGIASNIPIGDTAVIVTDNLFVPTADLDTGLYRMDYTLSVLDQEETDMSDNYDFEFFEVTEDLFAKEPFGNVAYNPFTGEWAMGAIYPTSVEKKTGYVALDAIFQLGTNTGVAMTDNFVDVYLLKVKPGINPLDFSSFDFNDTDINGHPSFDIIAQNTHVYTNEANYDVVSLPLSSTGEGVPLDPGAFYILLLRFEDIQAGAANQSNSELFMAANDIIPGSGFIFYSISNNQWFTGFVDFEPAWVLRMTVALSTSTDEVPLEDHIFQVYPNPSPDYITAKFDFEKPTDVDLILADLTGRIIGIKPLKGVVRVEEKINVGELANGTYILRADTNVGTRTHKVVVQH